MNIIFIGNCQTVSLCFYLQELLKSTAHNIYWISYGNYFNKYLREWSEKCKNKITDPGESISIIRDSDIIIYQNIDIRKSYFCNTERLKALKKKTCKLIIIPSIYYNEHDFDNCIKELIKRETINNVDIKVSCIIKKYKYKKLMITHRHPTTFLFMEIIKSLCVLLDIDFFNMNHYNKYLENENYMGLP